MGPVYRVGFLKVIFWRDARGEGVLGMGLWEGIMPGDGAGEEGATAWREDGVEVEIVVVGWGFGPLGMAWMKVGGDDGRS